MRGKRAKALRTEDRPHPGRKHGGVKSWERVRVKKTHSGFDHKRDRRSIKWTRLVEALRK